MRPELEDKLIRKYPKLFAQHELPMSETCMCWGISTGDGWYDLIDEICAFIAFHVKHNAVPNVEFVQVKQKFGGLRLYYDGGNEMIQGAVSFVESMSYKICEDCGLPGKPNDDGWITTLCDECRKKLYGIRKGNKKDVSVV